MLERAKGGDGVAFAELIRTFDPKLRGLAFQLLGDRELMDDVLQEVYLRAFRALPGFNGRAALGTWLYRITYNACIDELRRRQRRPWVGLADAQVEQMPASGEPLDERLARASAVREALAGLKPEERAAVWLVDAEGHDYAQAAGIIGVAEGTLASRLSRARAAMRRALAEEGSAVCSNGRRPTADPAPR